MQAIRPVFLILLLTSILASAQDSLKLRAWRDSAEKATMDTTRINYLRRLTNEYVNTNPDSAAFYSIRAVNFSRKIGWIKGAAQNLLNLGVALINASKFDSAIIVEGQALAASIKTGDSNRIGLVYINRGTAYTETAQFEKALSDLNMAIKIAEATGNKERKARASISLAQFYVRQENFKAALPWQMLALTTQQEIGDQEQVMICELNLGSIYLKTSMLPMAEKSLMAALRKSKTLQRDDVYIECPLSLSDLFWQQNKPDAGIVYLTAALKPAEKLGIIDRQAGLCMNLGNAFLQKKDPTRAANFFQKGMHYIEDAPAFRKIYYECMLGEAESLAALGRPAEAYQKTRLAARIKDSFQLATQNERLARLQTQFETERRDAEISLLHKDKELTSLNLQRQQSIRTTIIVFALLLLGIVGLSVARYRTLQQNRQLMEMEGLRQSISQDLHDDMGSTLSSIHINSNVALDQTGSSELVRDRLEKIRQNSGNMMQKMSDIVWAINPANDSIENLIVRMKEFCAELLEPLEMSVEVNEKISESSPIVGLEKRKEIFMIFKEAVNNCAKYSGAKSVWINIESTRNSFHLNVRDDGRGFDSTSMSSGNGLKNIKGRAAKMLGKAQIEAEIFNGTTVSIEIPLP